MSKVFDGVMIGEALAKDADREMFALSGVAVRLYATVSEDARSVDGNVLGAPFMLTIRDGRRSELAIHVSDALPDLYTEGVEALRFGRFGASAVVPVSESGARRLLRGASSARVRPRSE